MTLMCEFYKSHLSKNSQKFYDILLNNIHTLATDGCIELHGIYTAQSMHDATDAYIALRDDRPEFFFMDHAVEATLHFPGTLQIRQTKRFTFSQIQRINALLRREIEKILENCHGCSVLEKEKRIYKAIAGRYTYKEGEFSYDLSGLLVYKEGVCEALSGLLVIALRQAGIPAMKVHGRARGGNHCWTMAWINDRPYHLDVTWDLSRYKYFSDFQYFNVPESVIRKDHIIAAPGSLSITYT